MKEIVSLCKDDVCLSLSDSDSTVYLVVRKRSNELEVKTALTEVPHVVHGHGMANYRQQVMAAYEIQHTKYISYYPTKCN